ncbi:MAG: uracil-DNA glycosylase [Lentisphaerae bacterium]|nr:uracil-DNA glycosylase [Lentisphaerota bacterium]MCP4103683.1 uracil-DNA glycosylase [Lentisphaerota bacterium]
MAKDFFDEIIECLNAEGAKHKTVSLSEATAREFFMDKQASPFVPKTEVLQPAQQRQVQNNRPAQQRQKTQPVEQPVSKPIPQPQVQEQNQAQPVDFSKLDLQTLEQTALQCTRCPLCKKRNNVVFGEGNPNADLMFIGEGPGYDEDKQGRPFVGKAGMLLTKMINAMQFSREEVYIANIVKCRPPGNRNPLPEEAECCLPYLRRQIELIQPKILVLLGAVPLKFLLNKTGIMRSRGHWEKFQGLKVMPTFHPAYLLRNPAAKRETWQDLQQVMTIFGKAHKK